MVPERKKINIENLDWIAGIIAIIGLIWGAALLYGSVKDHEKRITDLEGQRKEIIETHTYVKLIAKHLNIEIKKDPVNE